MTALEIIKKSAILLNERKILDDENLTEITTSNQETVLENNFTLNRMFELLKIMMTDISTDYIQLGREASATATNGVIDTANIVNLLKVIEVIKSGVKMPFKIVKGKLTVNFSGDCIIKYLTTPNVSSVLDEVDDFKGLAGYDLLIYGLTSMYCLAVGLFDEYNIYNSIYEQKLAEAKSLKIITMPMRSWE